MIDTLALFFTCGVSLDDWLQGGIFDREKRIYEEQIRYGNIQRVLWLTYGINDKIIGKQLQKEGRLDTNIHILPMPRLFTSRAGNVAYSLAAPFIHAQALRKASVLKTNQMKGAWTALLAGALHRKPTLVRTGFTLSLFQAYQHGHTAMKARISRQIERVVYQHCDMAAVSSRLDREHLAAAHSGCDIRLLPNYVDTDLFHPGDAPRSPNRLVFVGRLHTQKNLASLIPVLRETGYGLDVYGAGPEETPLRELAVRFDADVMFHGPIPNDSLPEALRRAEAFILPSTFEGMPKALLEAMACGCVCVGADVPGVNEVITDGVNGLLAPAPTEEGFLTVLRRLAQADKPALSAAGVAHIEAHYSLTAVVNTEAAMLEELARRDESHTHP